MPLNISPSNPEWLRCVLNNFNAFLRDHASAEKKASGMAMTFVSHYPDKIELVEYMCELAIEELSHFKEVVKIIHQKGLQLEGDKKDAYVNQFMKHLRKGSEYYLLDRLLIAGIIEARGHERFALIALHLQDEKLKSFYQSIARSEERHYLQFIRLAKMYSPDDGMDQRLQDLIVIEGDIISRLPIIAALH